MTLPLINSDELAAIHQKVLERKTRQAIATTFAPGLHTSRQRGQGVELVDTRPYHDGDDIRHMDWRATARSGKATMKVFREERQRNLYLVIDKTSTMQFGTRTTFKANAAARAAAILALSTVTQHEPTAGLIIGEQSRSFPPTRSTNKVINLINAIAAPIETKTTPLWHNADINTLLTQARQETQLGSTLILISDFIGFDKKHQPLISQLAHQRQLIAIHVTDPAEQSIPDIGEVSFYSPITLKQHRVNTSDPNVREAFEKSMQQRHTALRRFFASCNAPTYPLNTQQDVFSQLEGVW